MFGNMAVAEGDLDKDEGDGTIEDIISHPHEFEKAQGQIRFSQKQNKITSGHKNNMLRNREEF